MVSIKFAYSSGLLQCMERIIYSNWFSSLHQLPCHKQATLRSPAISNTQFPPLRPSPRTALSLSLYRQESWFSRAVPVSHNRPAVHYTGHWYARCLFFLRQVHRPTFTHTHTHTLPSYFGQLPSFWVFQRNEMVSSCQTESLDIVPILYRLAAAGITWKAGHSWLF